MDPRDEIEPEQRETLTGAFRDQLLACLEECARGREGLFSSYVTEDAGEAGGVWAEAERLRELAMALQQILAQAGEIDAMCDEFLDLCSIHGESDPGEARLARAFLKRIEKGGVGQQLPGEGRPW